MLFKKHIEELLLNKSKDHNTILITLGKKQSDSIFNKTVEDQLYTKIYNKLLIYKFTNNNILQYKCNNKELLIIDKKISAIEYNNINSEIYDDYFISIFNQNNIKLVEFPCKQNYHNINKYQQISFTINENLDIFTIEKDKSIIIKIKINSYIYDTIKKVIEIFD